MSSNLIQIYEWQKLAIGFQGFKQNHVKALLKLNELHGFNYLEATVNGVRFRNYVGIIQVDNLTIEILPKVDSESNSSYWRDFLMNMLVVCKKVKAYNKEDALVGKKSFHLFDIYMNMFLNELDLLIRQGIFKEYRLHTSNLMALKGKLEIGKQISKNLVHKERFFTTHQTYDSDTLIHQILKKALEIIRIMASQDYIKSKSNRLSLNFPDLKANHITAQSFERLTLNRKTKSYSKALELAKVIIGNYSPQISSGKNKMLALLFNMDHLWEEYLFETLKKYQLDYGYSVERKSKPLFTSGTYFLQPDIILKIKDQIFILDAKWKQPRNGHSSQADLRQVYTYCKYWNAQKGVLVYPGVILNSSLIFADPEKLISCNLMYLKKEAVQANDSALVDEILQNLFH